MNLYQHILRATAFSRATFGPGKRMKGVIDHIQKELVEVEKSGGAASEWVDVVILGLDGLTRELMFSDDGAYAPRDPKDVAEIACAMIEGKQSRNEARVWPDWRTAEPDKAIEHDRSHD